MYIYFNISQLVYFLHRYFLQFVAEMQIFMPTWVERCILPLIRILKQLLGMTSIFVFLFCNEVVYPTDHDFIFYGIFKNIFHSHFYESDCNPNKLSVYLNTYLLKDV